MQYKVVKNIKIFLTKLIIRKVNIIIFENPGVLIMLFAEGDGFMDYS